MLKYLPWNWLMCIEPGFLTFVPDDLKIQEMCNEAMRSLKKRHGCCAMYQIVLGT